ncbi:hypothetical protein [Streptomyces sp. AM8-1-1]|uniref:hypothetical protein n=1 Tax=Streptomyces sp. AM8-1-1 TaxID=3075825 RepID=UPI0028C3D9D0|nr:hypothetical protein [Streptomyces sp. AM8-1-1]WNO70160.1 hypothetical protein RPQ07_00230 [Streptomyces sp. AM8-1-1]WNO76956.1 hypothetical protein RPQ07_37495 [Streptomyces sp. AM8-1-1]
MTRTLLDDLNEHDWEWDWLSPVTPWWSWGDVGEFWLVRRLLSMLRDSQLAHWHDPAREPVCILDDLTRLNTRRTKPTTDRARALALRPKLRTVTATLRAVHGLQLLLQLRLDQYTHRARRLGIPWERILPVLESGAGDRSLQRDGRVTTRQAVEKRWKTIEVGEAALAPWTGGPFKNGLDEIIGILAAEHMQQVADIRVPNIFDLVARERSAQNDQERRMAALRRRAADGQAEWQQTWDDWSPQQRTALASVVAISQLQYRAANDQESLVYEARRREATWEDVGLALGMSRQAAHERFSDWLSGDQALPVSDRLHREVRLACVVASRLLDSPTASTTDKELARRFYTPAGPDSAYRNHRPGCCLR